MKTWDKLDSPERLIETFLNFPSTIKWRIISALNKGVEPASVEAFYSQCLILRDRYPDVFRVEHVDVAHVNDRAVISNPSKDFKTAIARFKSRQKQQIHNRSSYLEARYRIGSLILLREIHDQSLVCEIINCAVQIPKLPKIATVVHLLENYEEYKEYPVNWTLELLEGEK